MPPTSDRDFLSAAGQRLEAARALFHGGLTLDAQYLGGYVVECSIKAVILHHTAYGGLLSSCRQAAALVTGGPGGPPGRLRKRDSRGLKARPPSLKSAVFLVWMSGCRPTPA